MPFPKGISNNYQFQIITNFKSIRNLKFDVGNWKFSSGFTLIELLVVVGILVIVAGTSILFLASILRGTNQANVTAEVKQNGQAVLDLLDRQIRGAAVASELVSPQLPTEASNGLVLTLADGNLLYVICVDSVGNANGYIATVTKTPGAGVATFSDYQTVTNQHTANGVDIDCVTSPVKNFTVIGGAGGSPAIVRVFFEANQGKQAPSRQDFLAKAKFETTISLRRY